MANIVAASATYTVNYKRRLGNSKVINNVTIAFGNGTLTYAAGGLPLTGSSMGCPNNIESLHVLSCNSAGSTVGSGYRAVWNQSNGSLMLFRTGATATVEIEATNDVPPQQTVVVDVIGW